MPSSVPFAAGSGRDEKGRVPGRQASDARVRDQGADGEDREGEGGGEDGGSAAQLRAGFLKMIPIGIPTYAGESLKTHLWSGDVVAYRELLCSFQAGKALLVFFREGPKDPLNWPQIFCKAASLKILCTS